jgi:hypothetical protein
MLSFTVLSILHYTGNFVKVNEPDKRKGPEGPLDDASAAYFLAAVLPFMPGLLPAGACFAAAFFAGAG